MKPRSHVPCAFAVQRRPPRRNAPDIGRLGQSEIWQIFGKMDFYDNSQDEEKVQITAYLLVI
ncbi:MAG: hypothetical protein DMG50_01695 [Acidobacteria bacterium]|nr:MAG: hypothetical protein DMG50_01695 [Acidobacteriota bacterium]